MDNNERILVRSFMSIRTYAILAIFAAILGVLLFSAGCGNAAPKSSTDGPFDQACSKASHERPRAAQKTSPGPAMRLETS